MKFRPLHIVFVALGVWLSGCAIPADMSPGLDAGGVHEYFWPTRNSSLEYHVYADGLGGTPVVHQVTLSRSGDTLFAYDIANGQTGVITSRLTANGVLLTDIQSTALFPLPEGAYISKSSREEKVKRYLAVSNVVRTKQRTVIFTGEGIFATTSYDNWINIDSAFSDVITSTASSLERSRYYAGSSDGDVYLTEDEGGSWFKIFNAGGSIEGIVIAEDGSLYLGVNGVGVIQWRKGEQFGYGSSLPSKNVTGLSSMYSPLGEELIVSTSDKGAFVLGIGSQDSWRVLSNDLKARPVLGIDGYAEKAVALLEAGYFSVSNDSGRTWQLHNVGVASGNQLTAVSVEEQGAFIAASDGQVFRLANDRPLELLGGIGSAVLAVQQDGGGDVLTASSRGLIGLSAGESQIDLGPFLLQTDSTRGEFKLLHSNTGVLTLDDSWDAGTLYLPVGVMGIHHFPITARVIEHLDSLRVDDQSFSDVFVVRYTFEHASKPLDGPQWLLYFSRNVGPVMIDRVANSSNLSTPMSRAIYIRKP